MQARATFFTPPERTTRIVRRWPAENLPYDYVAIHLNRNGGEQYSDSFLKVNPQRPVPVLQDDTLTLSQSLAIIEYVDERYHDLPLIPDSIEGRARVRALSLHCL